MRLNGASPKYKRESGMRIIIAAGTKGSKPHVWRCIARVDGKHTGLGDRGCCAFPELEIFVLQHWKVGDGNSLIPIDNYLSNTTVG